MQKIVGLIGYVNKSDFIINIAKVLNIMDKKVLVIDATIEKRLKYTLPIIDYTKKSYITNFDEVDYAVGFNSFEEVKKYMCKDEIHIETYDYILIDIDSPMAIEKFNYKEIKLKYFFMEYTNISTEKNKEILKQMQEIKEIDAKMEMIKVLFRNYYTRTSDVYYESKIEEFNIEWISEPYELSYEDQDKIVDIEAQQSGYIEVNKHTKNFQNIVVNIVNEIIGDTSEGEIKKMIKMYIRRKI